MAKEGLQVVLRTLRSIARASGRVSIVIMILLMLVDSERKLFVAQFFQFACHRDVHAAKHIHFALVHCDGVQGLRQKVFEFYYVTLLRLHSLLMLDESLQ
jgi:hypothetical protein